MRVAGDDHILTWVANEVEAVPLLILVDEGRSPELSWTPQSQENIAGMSGRRAVHALARPSPREGWLAMAKRSDTTKPPRRGASPAGKKRLMSTPRLKKGPKPLLSAEKFSAWVVELNGRFAKMLDDMEIGQVLAGLDELQEDLDTGFGLDLPSNDAIRRKLQDELKAIRAKAAPLAERQTLFQLGIQLRNEAHSCVVEAMRLRMALEWPDKFPDVLKAYSKHIQDTLLAQIFVSGGKREGKSDIPELSREAFQRVFLSSMPMDREFREIMATVAASEEQRESPAWRSRQLIFKDRPRPKSLNGKKAGPRPDHIKKMRMVEFVRRRIKQGAKATSAVEAASLKFRVGESRIFKLWTADQQFWAKFDRELELSEGRQSDKDK